MRKLTLLFTMLLCGIYAKAQNLKYDLNNDSTEDIGDVAFLVNHILNRDKNNNAHEYVDLGLSVKWATCNIGADYPEDYGDYFAWGETTGYNAGKICFDWNNYSLCDSSYTALTKYNTSSSYGTVDNKTTLELDDDAAYVNWGGDWRMPTGSEMTEIRTGCYWEWTSDYDHSGKAGYIVYKVKSDSDKGVKKYSSGKYSATLTGSYSFSDTHIFLPTGGDIEGSSFMRVGTHGLYWSSTLHGRYKEDAYMLWTDGSTVAVDNGGRSSGLPVRPVRP